ncbi:MULTISPECIES: c-type cytochrome [Sphingomonas]|jgi:cytochrome c556|uniref:c-type cytochrome n=1 Tax=Sphingomonas TaxID=13687 RepID=UPI00082F09FE|nr:MULTISPECIES: cytochrome c [Sphingomonas]
MTMMRNTIGAALVLATLTAAAPPPQQVVAARHAGFKKMGAAMKALGDQLKSDAPAKPAMVAAAQAIVTTARQQAALFPAGTGPGAGVKTDALPAIWTNRAAFDAQMKALIAESGKLVAVTNGGDVTAIRAQMKATGATCAACHRQFRAED